MKLSITKTTVDYAVELNEVLETFFERNVTAASNVSPYYGALWSEMRRLIQSGGKRLRPKMTILAYEAFGGDDHKAILPIAAAQELLHVSLLVHDDIIDRDYIRYGVDNIAGGYSKIYEKHVSDKTDLLHYSHSAALLAGDLLISGSYELMTESTIAPAKIIQAQRLFAQSMFAVAGGELLDTESAFRELGLISAELVALYKTASYSFVGPFVIGATLADASVDDIRGLRLFAENIGIAYQLRDDIIGIFGDETKTGKPTKSDIQEGKKTYMIEQFVQYATNEQRVSFNRYFGNQSITSEEAEIIKELLVISGAKQKTEEAISVYEMQARRALNSLTIVSDFNERIEELIAVATRRSQ
ncbi:MAG: polyprenyl synthetase family protein [Candidatus Microsaccharimonas sp.]